MSQASRRARLTTAVGRQAAAAVALTLLTVLTGSGTSAAETATPGLDAPSYTEYWSSLDGWNARGLSVQANRVYGSAATVAGAIRAMPVEAGSDSRIRASIVFKPGGTSGLTAIGVSNSEPGAAPSGSTFMGIGVLPTGYPVAYRGTDAGGRGIVPLGSTRLTSGWYWVTVTTDAVGLSMVMTNSDGTQEWRTAVRRSQIPGGITHAAIWNSDSRAKLGTAIGALGYRLSATPLTDAPTIEGPVPSVTWGWGHGTAQHIALPGDYDPRRPVPLVLYAHGYLGGELAVLQSEMLHLYRALLRDGYAVASSSQFGDNWGNRQGADALVALYNYVDARYPVSEVFLIGHSMGGLSSLQAATSDAMPVAAWAGIYPVTNLQAMWDSGLFHRSITVAHDIAPDGSDWADRTAGLDPAAFDHAEFAGLPMRFYASTSDTIVPMASHSAQLAAHVAGVGPEAEVVDHVGEHGDPTAYRPRDLVEFFNRHRTA